MIQISIEYKNDYTTKLVVSVVFDQVIMKCTFIVWCFQGKPDDVDNHIYEIAIEQVNANCSSVFGVIVDKNSLQDIIHIIDGGYTKRGDNFIDYLDEFVTDDNIHHKGDSYTIQCRSSGISFRRGGDIIRFAPEYKEKIREIISNIITLNQGDGPVEYSVW